MTQTTFDKIVKYLSKKRKTPATSWEIAWNTDTNPNTVRKILGDGLGNAFKKFDERHCTVQGTLCSTYHLLKAA